MVPRQLRPVPIICFAAFEYLVEGSPGRLLLPRYKGRLGTSSVSLIKVGTP